MKEDMSFDSVVVLIRQSLKNKNVSNTVQNFSFSSSSNAMERMDDLNLVHRDNSNLITARKRALKRKANVEKKSAFLNADNINVNNLIQINRPSENQNNRFRVSNSLSKGNYIAKINPNIVCFSCGKVGHPANKCPKKPNLG